jgi:hypothetical protein
MQTTIQAVRQRSGWFSVNVSGEAGETNTETDAVGTAAADSAADCTAAAANTANTAADDDDHHY